MNKQEKAKQLRAQGLTYWEIGQQIGTSDTMARNYVLDISNRRPTGRENAPYACGKTRPGHEVVCQRRIKHEGIHLGNDKANRLIYWE
jgi:hypothetical protein